MMTRNRSIRLITRFRRPNEINIKYSSFGICRFCLQIPPSFCMICIATNRTAPNQSWQWPTNSNNDKQKRLLIIFKWSACAYARRRTIPETKMELRTIDDFFSVNALFALTITFEKLAPDSSCLLKRIHKTAYQNAHYAQYQNSILIAFCFFHFSSSLSLLFGICILCTCKLSLFSNLFHFIFLLAFLFSTFFSLLLFHWYLLL